MKKQSVSRHAMRVAAAGLACSLALPLTTALALQSQSMGQVSGQPSGVGASQQQGSGTGTQQTGPAPGMGQNPIMSGAAPYGSATQQLSTGSDIPQLSVTAQISIGDLLDVLVFDTPELSGRFRVNDQGNIILPLVGPLHVDGMSAAEASSAVAKIYRDKQVMLQPQVTVFVTEYSSKGVTVTGEVRSPGIYPLTGPLDLNDLLARAGGLNGDASKTVSIVHRREPGKIITVKLNVGAQTPASIAAANVAILPGDTIFVARSGIVYLIGDVNRPGGYEVEHNDRLTLLNAIALAGGPSSTAKLWDARLIRRTAGGREDLKIDLKKVLVGDGLDMYMTDGDILYVPVSQRKVYTQAAINASISAATAFAIYKISQF